MQQDRPAAAVYRGRQKGSGNEIRENFLLHAILSFVSTIQNTTKTKETSGEAQKKKANSNDVELSREAKLYIAHAQAGAANEITRVRGQRGKTKQKRGGKKCRKKDG